MSSGLGMQKGHWPFSLVHPGEQWDSQQHVRFGICDNSLLFILAKVLGLAKPKSSKIALD